MSLPSPARAARRALLAPLCLASAVGAGTIAPASAAPERPPAAAPARHVVRFLPGAPDAVRAAFVAAAHTRVARAIPALDIVVLEAADAADGITGFPGAPEGSAGVPASLTAARPDVTTLAASPGFRSAIAYVEADGAVAVAGEPVPSASTSAPAAPGLGFDSVGRAPWRPIRGHADRRNAVAADGPAAGVPNDPLFDRQWHHAAIGSATAWEWSRGDGVIVAVVDSGVSCDVPDLAGRCVAGVDFVNDDADPSDDQGHGTFVAGVIAAAVHNRAGGAGVAGEARVMPLKALGASGSGAMSDIAAAVVHAADHGARVVNLSLGGFYRSQALADAVAYARGRGVVVVAAAGSEATSNPTYPAAYPGVIAVAATTPSDARAAFSNGGAWIDIAAPGAGILSATRGGGYQAWSGTSLSSAVVAGAAALLAGQDPGRDPDAVERLMLATASDTGTPGWDPSFGAGRLDAGAALVLGAGERMPAPPVVDPPPVPTEGPPVDPPLPRDPD